MTQNATPTVAPANDVAARTAARTLAARTTSYTQEVRRLLDAGLTVVGRCGTSSRPRVADIVAESGLSNDAFYRHFPSKDALVAALIEDGTERLASYVAHQMSKEAQPATQVRRWVEAVLSQARPEIAAPTLALMWNGGSSSGGVAAGRHPAAARLAALLHAPFAELGSEDPVLDAALAAHAALGALTDYLWNKAEPTPADLTKITQFCLRAVRPATAQPGGGGAMAAPAGRRALTGPASPTGPATATPPPRPGLVRRTTTHDSLRLTGLFGPVTHDARGRDAVMGHDETPRVLAQAALVAEIAYGTHTITQLRSSPPDPRLAALVGRGATTGFRQAVDEVLPGERTSHSVLFQLLDDLPIALLISGHSWQRARDGAPANELGVESGGATGSPAAGDGVAPRPRRAARQVPDLCAGWATGGTILTGIACTGQVPTPYGPVVVPLAGDEPLGWHATAPLPAHGMRRRRRLDVWREPGEAEVRVECFFRDSHMAPDGVETALHEYTVHATVDPVTTTFTSCRADFGALPWLECPAALASAGRLVGLRPDGLRRLVRDTFTGVSTCTHLNDTLRSLEDVGALIDLLPK